MNEIEQAYQLYYRLDNARGQLDAHNDGVFEDARIKNRLKVVSGVVSIAMMELLAFIADHKEDEAG